MESKYVALIAFAVFGLASAGPVATDAAEPVPQPAYQPQEAYVPHTVYPYSSSYQNPDGYLVPAEGLGPYGQPGEFITDLIPSGQTALQVAMKMFAKVGMFLVGGTSLLVVGGMLMTAVCSLTPFCTITFAGFRNINKDTMRSYVTPDSLSAAATFVQDAIGKYQRLQRAVGNGHK